MRFYLKSSMGSRVTIFSFPLGAIFKDSFTILRYSQQHSFLIASRVCISMSSLPLLSLTESGTARSLSGGKLAQFSHPILVMPITVEHTKPRMCHDKRCLNLWIKDLPLSLDYISGLPLTIKVAMIILGCQPTISPTWVYSGRAGTFAITLYPFFALSFTIRLD